MGQKSLHSIPNITLQNLNQTSPINQQSQSLNYQGKTKLTKHKSDLLSTTHTTLFLKGLENNEVERTTKREFLSVGEVHKATF